MPFGGDYKFLYLSPERIATERFRERINQLDVNLIAVDEAHCISQWGYDFRPSYLRIAELRDLLPDVPVACGYCNSNRAGRQRYSGSTEIQAEKMHSGRVITGAIWFIWSGMRRIR